MSAKPLNKYSTQILSQSLIDEIIHSLKTIQGFGSLEIFVQDNMVSQITVRNIKKTLGKSQVTAKPH